MQRVSTAYKRSMKGLLRERAYMMVLFGVIEQEAQANATIENDDFTYYSNASDLFRQREEEFLYATMEENFTKVDGTMYFLPKEGWDGLYLNDGVVSKNILTDAVFELDMNTNVDPLDFRGFTINFGDNYATNFDIVGENNTIEIRGNDKPEFATEQILYNTTSVKIRVFNMKNEHSRCRIFSMTFGYGLIFDNKVITNSKLESYVSPIGAEVPQMDFSVTVTNYNKYFNVDNPDSAINFLETGQELKVFYGYQLPDSGEIEWMQGGRLLCSEWESDDKQATIKGQDVLRNMETEFYKGRYSEEPRSFYDLVVEILDDAGEEDYYVDSRLKKLFTKCPIPRVSHKEALQIIANACRCVLTVTRNGHIQIRSNFEPKPTVSCNAEAEYSHVAKVLVDEDKDEYATMATDYTDAEGRLFFIPKDVSLADKNTAFISDVQSDEKGLFTENPKVTINLEFPRVYYGFTMRFGNSIPSEIILHTYKEDEEVETITIDSDITKDFVFNYEFYEFDRIEAEFVKTAKPHNRIVLNYFMLGETINFTMERVDMTSSPKAIKQELTKDVIVPCYTYTSGKEEESLVTEELDIVEGTQETFYLGEPSYNFRATLGESEDGIRIVDSGSFFVTVEYSVTGKYEVGVHGYKYQITERHATNSLNPRGKSITWENPMISDMEMATDLSTWIGDYYNSVAEYEYTTRGNPEIDVNDVIYQENDFVENMKVDVYRTVLEFKQAFKGKVYTRKQGA